MLYDLNHSGGSLQSQRYAVLYTTVTSFRLFGLGSAKRVSEGVHYRPLVMARMCRDADENPEMITAQRVHFGAPGEMLGSRSPRKDRCHVSFSKTLLEYRHLGRIIGHDEWQDVHHVFDVPSCGSCLLSPHSWWSLLKLPPSSTIEVAR